MSEALPHVAGLVDAMADRIDAFAEEVVDQRHAPAAAAQDRARPVDLGRDIAMVRAARFGAAE